MQESSVQNIIGGRHRISPRSGALSLVRKFDQAHAYLILEQYEGDERVISDMHLVIKRETEKLPNKKADIVHRELDVDDLLELGKKGLHSITWSVTQDQMKQLAELLKQEKKRVANNEIDYHVVGNALAAGLFGASLQAAQSESVRLWSVEHQKGSVSEYLLRRGHNCYSWAQGMAMNIGVNPPTIWNELIAKDPRKVLNKGAVEGEQPEPTTGPSSSGDCCLL